MHYNHLGGSTLNFAEDFGTLLTKSGKKGPLEIWEFQPASYARIILFFDNHN